MGRGINPPYRSILVTATSLVQATGCILRRCHRHFWSICVTTKHSDTQDTQSIEESIKTKVFIECLRSREKRPFVFAFQSTRVDRVGKVESTSIVESKLCVWCVLNTYSSVAGCSQIGNFGTPPYVSGTERGGKHATPRCSLPCIYRSGYCHAPAKSFLL